MLSGHHASHLSQYSHEDQAGLLDHYLHMHEINPNQYCTCIFVSAFVKSIC